jgi:serine/threonine protein kinase
MKRCPTCDRTFANALRFCVEDATPLLATDTLTLADLLHETVRLPARRAVYIAASLCDVLASVRGRSPATLTPIEIELNPNDTVHVTFSLDIRSKRVREDALDPAALYAAPEVLARDPATPAAVVYNVASVLFEMLTGNVPFVGHSDAAIAVRKLLEDAPSARFDLPDVSSELDAVVRLGLDRNPTTRPPAPTEFAVLLRALRIPESDSTVAPRRNSLAPTDKAARETRVQPSNAAHPHTSAARSRAGIWLLGGGVALALAAVSMLSFHRSERSANPARFTPAQSSAPSVASHTQTPAPSEPAPTSMPVTAPAAPPTPRALPPRNTPQIPYGNRATATHASRSGAPAARGSASAWLPTGQAGENDLTPGKPPRIRRPRHSPTVEIPHDEPAPTPTIATVATPAPTPAPPRVVPPAPVVRSTETVVDVAVTQPQQEDNRKHSAAILVGIITAIVGLACMAWGLTMLRKRRNTIATQQGVPQTSLPHVETAGAWKETRQTTLRNEGYAATIEVPHAIEQDVVWCAVCKNSSPASTNFCPNDGTSLRTTAITVDPHVRVESRSEMVAFTVGNYRCESRLGEGGMGVVYKARHVESGDVCAVKVLLTGHSTRNGLVNRFRKEARLAASIVHPNSVRVYDSGEVGGQMFYLAMEFLDGKSLEDVIGHKPLSVGRAANIVQQMCAGLEVAHAAGVVHRDLKPANVMICRQPDGGDLVKLVDFGIARDLQNQENTLSGLIVGTPAYMSPEQARGESDVGVRADVFALATMTWEMLSGKLPFEAEGNALQQVVARATLQSPAPPVSTVAPWVDARLDDVLMRATIPNPATRTENVTLFANEFLSAVHTNTAA